MHSKTEPAPKFMTQNYKAEITSALEQRIGRTHARLRLGIENEHEAQIFGQGLNFFHIENWYSGHSLLRKALRLNATTVYKSTLNFPYRKSRWCLTVVQRLQSKSTILDDRESTYSIGVCDTFVEHFFCQRFSALRSLASTFFHSKRC